MDATASMHGLTLARDDRIAPPRSVLKAAAAAQAEMSAAGRGALGSASLYAAAPIDRPPARKSAGALHSDGSSSHSGVKRPRSEVDALAVDAARSMSPGAYFELRSVKLADQAPSAVGTLFAGMSVYVNGRTTSADLTALSLAHLIRSHGGRVLTFPTIGQLTHIVAENLNGSKTDQMLHRHGTRRVPVIRPAYFTACVASGARLPVEGYEVVVDATTHRLDSMVGGAAGAAAAAAPASGGAGTSDSRAAPAAAGASGASGSSSSRARSTSGGSALSLPLAREAGVATAASASAQPPQSSSASSAWPRAVRKLAASSSDVRHAARASAGEGAAGSSAVTRGAVSSDASDARRHGATAVAAAAAVAATAATSGGSRGVGSSATAPPAKRRRGDDAASASTRGTASSGGTADRDRSTGAAAAAADDDVLVIDDDG